MVKRVLHPGGRLGHRVQRTHQETGPDLGPPLTIYVWDGVCLPIRITDLRRLGRGGVLRGRGLVWGGCLTAPGFRLPRFGWEAACTERGRSCRGTGTRAWGRCCRCRRTEERRYQEARSGPGPVTSVSGRARRAAMDTRGMPKPFRPPRPPPCPSCRPSCYPSVGGCEGGVGDLVTWWVGGWGGGIKLRGKAPGASLRSHNPPSYPPSCRPISSQASWARPPNTWPWPPPL